MIFRSYLFSAALFVAALIVGATASSQDVPVPTLTQHVTDQTGTLSAAQIAELEAQLVALEKRKGSQVVVLIIASTGSQALESYTLAVAEKNKLGRKKVDDGLILFIAKDDRKARIEVGYGLEGAVTDALSSRIIREYLTPKFRQGDFFGGINDSLQAMIKLIDGEPLPEPMMSDQSDSQPNFLFAGIFGFIIGVIASATGIKPVFLRRLGAAGVAFGLLMVLPSLGLSALIAGLVAFIAASLGQGGLGSGRGGGWSSGGGGWSSGGGGGGGGGWSGGGGSFGGGGASGGW